MFGKSKDPRLLFDSLPVFDIVFLSGYVCNSANHVLSNSSFIVDENQCSYTAIGLLTAFVAPCLDASFENLCVDVLHFWLSLCETFPPRSSNYHCGAWSPLGGDDCLIDPVEYKIDQIET